MSPQLARIFSFGVVLLASPAAFSGSGSCPAAGLNTIAGPVGACTLDTGDSVDVTASGSVAGTDFGVSVLDNRVAGSIANDGVIEASTVRNAVGIDFGRDSGLTGGIANRATISANASDAHATGILMQRGSTVGGGLINDGTIEAYGGDGPARGIIFRTALFSGAIENRGAIAIRAAPTGFSSASGILIESNLGFVTGPIVNSGSLTADAGLTAIGLIAETSTLMPGVLNESGATITARGGRFATGAVAVLTSNFRGGFVNDGTVSAIADGVGLAASGLSATVFSDIRGGVVNSGHITAEATVDAAGIRVNFDSDVSGGIDNSGVIEGNAGESAAGIAVAVGSDISGRVTNSGMIAGISSTGSAAGIHVDADSTISGGIVNRGTISGTTYSLDLRNVSAPFTIEHGGILDGDVNLGINVLALDGRGIAVRGTAFGNESAAVEIRGDSSFAGNLRFDGVGSVAIVPGARLDVDSTRTIESSVPVENHGTLAIAATGEQLIVGDYLHGAGAKLVLGAVDPLTHGRLTVQGTADVSALDAIELDVAGVDFAFGDVLHDVIAAERLDGADAISVVDDSDQLAFEVRRDGNTVDIITAPVVSFDELMSEFASSGLSAVGGALDSVISAGNSDADIRELFLELASLDSARAVADVLSQLTPTLQVGSGQFTKVSIAMTNTVLGRRIDARGSTGGAGDGDIPLARSAGWIMPFASWTDQDGQAGLPGYDGDTFGFAGGVDMKVRDDRLLLGIGFSHALSDVDGNAAITRSRLDVTSRQGYVYADYGIDTRTNLGVVFGGGTSSIEGSRRIASGAFERTASADYSSWDTFLNVNLARAYDISAITTVSPLIRFEYLHVESASYRETGAGGLGLDVGQVEQDQAVLLAGFDAVVNYTPQLAFTASAAVGVDVIDDDPSATGSFVGGGPAFVMNGAKQDAARLRGGVGIDYRSRDDGAALRLRYDVEGQREYTHQILSMQFRMRF